MANILNTSSAWLLVAGLAAAGCGSPATPADPAERPARAARPAAAPERAAVKIISVEPDEMVVRNGRGLPGEYVIKYSIGEPDRVEQAELNIYLPGIGDTILKQDVPIIPDNVLSIVISPQVDFGPTLRFRAVCPEGTTDWYTYGQEPLPLEERTAPGLRIMGIGPERIFYNMTGNTGGAERISIIGRELGPGCKAEGQVNGQPVGLMNTIAQKGKIETLLRRDDFGDTAVAKRYLEVKLSVRGPGLGKVAIAHIRMVE